MSNPAPALSKVLEHHTIQEARADLVEIDGRYGIVPPHARAALHQTLDELTAHATDLGLSTLGKVVRHAGKIIAAASGVMSGDHGRYLPPDQSDSLHLHRNVLLSLVLAGVMSYRGDLQEVATAFPKLKQRTRAMLRAYTDDETLLLRMWALHLSEGTKNNRRAAAVYAQCDTGLVAGETTKVFDSDIVLTPGDAMIEAPGLDVGVCGRVLPLEEFAVTLMRRYVDQAALPEGALLTYRPRRTDLNYVRAAASAIGIIDRIRAAVGLVHDDTTNASVWMWRAASTELTHGIDAAAAVSGRRADNLRAILRDRPRSTPTVGKKSKMLKLD